MVLLGTLLLLSIFLISFMFGDFSSGEVTPMEFSRDSSNMQQQLGIYGLSLIDVFHEDDNLIPFASADDDVFPGILMESSNSVNSRVHQPMIRNKESVDCTIGNFVRLKTLKHNANDSAVNKMDSKNSRPSSKAHDKRNFLRQSLDWDKAFFTSEGLLDHEELLDVQKNFVDPSEPKMANDRMLAPPLKHERLALPRQNQTKKCDLQHNKQLRSELETTKVHRRQSSLSPRNPVRPLNQPTNSQHKGPSSHVLQEDYLDTNKRNSIKNIGSTSYQIGVPLLLPVHKKAPSVSTSSHQKARLQSPTSLRRLNGSSPLSISTLSMESQKSIPSQSKRKLGKSIPSSGCLSKTISSVSKCVKKQIGKVFTGNKIRNEAQKTSSHKTHDKHNIRTKDTSRTKENTLRHFDDKQGATISRLESSSNLPLESPPSRLRKPSPRFGFFDEINKSSPWNPTTPNFTQMSLTKQTAHVQEMHYQAQTQPSIGYTGGSKQVSTGFYQTQVIRNEESVDCTIGNCVQLKTLKHNAIDSAVNKRDSKDSSPLSKARDKRNFLRQSLDWDKAFFTSEGLLDHEELLDVQKNFMDPSEQKMENDRMLVFPLKHERLALLQQNQMKKSDLQHNKQLPVVFASSAKDLVKIDPKPTNAHGNKIQHPNGHKGKASICTRKMTALRSELETTKVHRRQSSLSSRTHVRPLNQPTNSQHKGPASHVLQEDYLDASKRNSIKNIGSTSYLTGVPLLPPVHRKAPSISPSSHQKVRLRSPTSLGRLNGSSPLSKTSISTLSMKCQKSIPLKSNRELGKRIPSSGCLSKTISSVSKCVNKQIGKVFTGNKIRNEAQKTSSHKTHDEHNISASSSRSQASSLVTKCSETFERCYSYNAPCEPFPRPPVSNSTIHGIFKGPHRSNLLSKNSDSSTYCSDDSSSIFHSSASPRSSFDEFSSLSSSTHSVSPLQQTHESHVLSLEGKKEVCEHARRTKVNTLRHLDDEQRATISRLLSSLNQPLESPPSRLRKPSPRFGFFDEINKSRPWNPTTPNFTQMSLTRQRAHVQEMHSQVQTQPSTGYTGSSKPVSTGFYKTQGILMENLSSVNTHIYDPTIRNEESVDCTTGNFVQLKTLKHNADDSMVNRMDLKDSSSSRKELDRRSFLRQSLDWDRAFFTSEGLLDHDELLYLQRNFKNPSE